MGRRIYEIIEKVKPQAMPVARSLRERTIASALARHRRIRFSTISIRPSAGAGKGHRILELAGAPNADVPAKRTNANTSEVTA
jgi:hypothetical protein